MQSPRVQPEITGRCHRRGSIVPLVTVALLVVMLAIALVLNRLWLDNARIELQSAADAAVLSAAGALACDDRLKSLDGMQELLPKARDAAAKIAAENHVAGEPLELDSEPEGDIRFGRLVENDEQQTIFLETEHDPRTIVVTARRNRSHANPVTLVMDGVSGPANILARAEASLDCDLVGLRPTELVNVPAIPLALSSVLWGTQITGRTGTDLFSVDPETDEVSPGPDGIPEIVVNGVDQETPATCCMLDVGTGLSLDPLTKQIEKGITVEHLEGHNGELRSGSTATQLPATANLGGEHLSVLGSMTGKARIFFLYTPDSPTAPAPTNVRCAGFVAGRVMAIVPVPNHASRIVIQPSVIVTRTAVVAKDLPEGDPARKTEETAAKYEYVFKVTLTQ